MYLSGEEFSRIVNGEFIAAVKATVSSVSADDGDAVSAALSNITGMVDVLDRIAKKLEEHDG